MLPGLGPYVEKNPRRLFAGRVQPPPACHNEGRAAVKEAAGVLHWDMSTVMPDGGRPARAEQLATLGVVCHEILTEAETGALLDQAEGQADALTDWQRANLAEMRRGYTHATALDSDLVEAMSKAATACEAVWREARPKGDFALVYPLLSEVLEKVIKELPRDATAVELFNKLAGAEPLPPR